MKKETAIILLVASAAGQYIPKEFIEITKNVKGWDYGISKDDLETLKNPEGEWYWDVWNDMLTNATFTSAAGQEFTLHQDGDLWAICYDDMTEEEKDNFGLNDY